jgi:hypothetical protein
VTHLVELADHDVALSLHCLFLSTIPSDDLSQPSAGPYVVADPAIQNELWQARLGLFLQRSLRTLVRQRTCDDRGLVLPPLVALQLFLRHEIPAIAPATPDLTIDLDLVEQVPFRVRREPVVDGALAEVT